MEPHLCRSEAGKRFHEAWGHGRPADHPEPERTPGERANRGDDEPERGEIAEVSVFDHDEQWASARLRIDQVDESATHLVAHEHAIATRSSAVQDAALVDERQSRGDAASEVECLLEAQCAAPEA